MKVSIFGSGYVGLVTGVCLADLGNDVLCADVDEKKVAMLKQGECPIFEPGLGEKMERNIREGRLSFTADLPKAVTEGDILFLAVGTPSKKDGSVDLSYVESAAATIGEHLDREKVVVDKSTVPVGTAAKVRTLIEAGLAARGAKHPFHVVSNPEFLREGAAVYDFFNPDRIVVGLEGDDLYARDAMEKLYKGVARTNRPLLFTDVRSAELIKYASNAMLATRISFMNQLSGYCERVGADITAVAKGMGLDTRIGPRFLHAGIGYGGSCFPKDVQGIIDCLKAEGCDASIFESVHQTNEAQKRSLFPKVERLIGAGGEGTVGGAQGAGNGTSGLAGKTVALWGLAFKPKTDDVREAPSHAIVSWLLAHGAKVRAFDPEAAENFAKEHAAERGITYVKAPYEALEQADLLLLLTEWDEFRNPDWERMKKAMRSPNIIDGRNIWLGYREDLKRLGFRYEGVGVKGF